MNRDDITLVEFKEAVASASDEFAEIDELCVRWLMTALRSRGSDAEFAVAIVAEIANHYL